jgi:hypothetical protein
MELQSQKATVIRLNKKYLRIITSYLQQNNYQYRIAKDEMNPSKVKIEIPDLNPEAAFYFGVNAQVQLVDGEILL